MEVPLKDLPEGIEVGSKLQAGDGRPINVTAIGETSATLDGNHPLAGQSLTFAVEMVAVKVRRNNIAVSS
jgi:peptidylprolyl isomerase